MKATGVDLTISSNGITTAVDGSTDAIDILASNLAISLASLEERLKSPGTGNRDNLFLLAANILSSSFP